MKTKSFSKKVTLKKTTVANLSDQNMNQVVGGGSGATLLSVCRLCNTRETCRFCPC